MEAANSHVLDMSVTNGGHGGKTHSKQGYQIAVTALFLSLAIPAVVTRIWVRKHMINSLGADDYMMVLALVGFILYNASLMEIVSKGGGTHVSIESVSLKSAIDWLLVNEVFYLVTHTFLKLSLGLFFLRVVVRRGYRQLIVVTMIASSVVNVGNIFFLIFRCGDPTKFETHQLQNRCVRPQASVSTGYLQAATGTITDLVFAILPVTLLWNATMDIRSKLSAGIILGLGAIGCVASIVRFPYVKDLEFTEDFFWSAVDISIWSNIELGLGITAGSLATFRPLLKRVVAATRCRITGRTFARSRTARSKTAEITPSDEPDTLNVESLHSIFKPWESVGESGGYVTTVVGGMPARERNSSKAGLMVFSNNTSRDSMVAPPAASLKKSSPRKTKHMLDSNRSFDILASAERSDRAAIWPFWEEPPPNYAGSNSNGVSGISKVVDVSVSVTDSHPSPFASEHTTPQSATRSVRRSEEGGGLWGMRIEDRIKRPDRVHSTSGGGGRSHSTSHNDDRDGCDETATTTLTRSSTPEWERLPDLVQLAELASPTAEAVTHADRYQQRFQSQSQSRCPHAL